MSNNDVLSEKNNNYLVPDALILIDDTKLSKESVFFTNLEIDKVLDGYDTCTFLIHNSIDLEFNSKMNEDYELGDEVKVYIGYAQADTTLVFKGFITNIKWNFSEDDHLDIFIEAKDYTFLMMKNKYEKSMIDMTASDIVENIITERYPNLIVEAGATDIKYEKIENDKENDYLFIKSLAQKSNFEFFIDNGTVNFRPIPQTLKSTITLTYGKDILSFKPELNIEKEVTSVKIIGLELSKDKEAIIGEAFIDESDSNETNKGIRKLFGELEYKVRESVKNQEEADLRAEFLLNSFSNNSHKAWIKSIGLPTLKPGITVTLEGVGNKFSRDYYIIKCVHSLNEDGYETVLSVVFKKDKYE